QTIVKRSHVWLSAHDIESEHDQQAEQYTHGELSPTLPKTTAHTFISSAHDRDAVVTLVSPKLPTLGASDQVCSRGLKPRDYILGLKIRVRSDSLENKLLSTTALSATPARRGACGRRRRRKWRLWSKN